MMLTSSSKAFHDESLATAPFGTTLLRNVEVGAVILVVSRHAIIAMRRADVP
jgi:hypothetical protein